MHLDTMPIRELEARIDHAVRMCTSGAAKMDLNMVANQLMQLGGMVHVSVFINGHAIQIVDLGFGGQGHEYHFEQHPHDMYEGIHEGAVDGGLSK